MKNLILTVSLFIGMFSCAGFKSLSAQPSGLANSALNYMIQLDSIKHSALEGGVSNTFRIIISSNGEIYNEKVNLKIINKDIPNITGRDIPNSIIDNIPGSNHHLKITVKGRRSIFRKGISQTNILRWGGTSSFSESLSLSNGTVNSIITIYGRIIETNN